jgi:cytochrome c biogenesis factor
VHPLIGWIWAGGLVVILGGLVALWPTGRGRRAAPATAA